MAVTCDQCECTEMDREGFVLRPLFLLYINDIADSVISKTLTSADDPKIIA